MGYYRDSKDYYLSADAPAPSPKMEDFIIRNIKDSQSVLDIGCANGLYSKAILKRRLIYVGVDVNFDYLKEARAKGNKVILVGDILPLKKKVFDTILLLEILEHVERPEVLLEQAAAIARKNILITVPSCERFEELKTSGITYEHFLDLDHRQFFTRKKIESLLKKISSRYSISEEDPIIYYGTRVLFKLHLLKPRYYRRFYVTINL